ncbi:FIST signal transduction protein [Methylophaga sp. OBS3]|uniref:FIST signal transduction protein n=1 Tax=Methylophaga sp. OBS3 TaxID=2991934 RepID=UPI002256D6A7|nr:FIST N-terminal domain-containing protein [Methylophaga sp. OBS3]MCX4189943.1 FIST C-terminal domain-containing protein [Methylophaga sp. OBS3]
MKFAQEHLPAKTAISKLPGKSPLAEANWVLVFGSVNRFGERNFAAQLQKRYPNAQIIGCTTSGEITGDGVFDDSVHITAMHWERSQLRFITKPVNSMEQSHALGSQIANELLAPDLKGLFVLSDGLNVNGSELVEGLQEVLPNVPITGGLAGDAAQFTQTLLLNNDKIQDRVVIAVGIYGKDAIVTSGALGGWKPYGPPRRITRANKNVVYELDNKPALPLYKMYIGYYANELPASGLNFPFAIMDDKNVNVIRTLLSISEKDNSLTFAGNIAEGSTVRFLKSDHDQLVVGASEAARQILQKEVDINDKALAICVSCVGRKLVMQDQVSDEVFAVQRLLGMQTGITGFYSNGEICSGEDDSHSLLHNQTMTIAYLSEHAS